MCVSPILIKNQLYGQKINKFSALKDCVSSHIHVPCGKCPQCVARKQNDFSERVNLEAKNNYVFFNTLTYDNPHLPTITIGDKTFAYANPAHISGMFKRIRRTADLFGRKIRYRYMSEFGSKKGRPHWHGLIFISKEPTDTPEFETLLEARVAEAILKEWRINVALNKNGKPNTRNPKYEPLFTDTEKFVNGKLMRNFDCHLIRPNDKSNGVPDVAYYVSKYMSKSCSWNNRYYSQLKEVCTNSGFDDEELRDLWRIIRPHTVSSLYFGLQGERTPFGDMLASEEIVNHIKEGIDFAVKNNLEGPIWFDPHTGKQLPLAKYYEKKYLTYEDAYHFRKHLIDPAYGCVVRNNTCEKQEARNTAVIRSHLARIVEKVASNYPDNFTLVDTNNLSNDPLIMFDF